MRIEWMVCAAAALAAAPASADSEGGGYEKLGEVFFGFDSARVEGTAALDRIVQWTEENPAMTIVLDGFADPRGGSPYNVALAARRADGVRSRLVARGVDADRIVIVTFGEDGDRRATYRLDRRVTAWGTAEPLYAIIERSIGTGTATAVLWNKPVEATAMQVPRPDPDLPR